MFYMTFIYLLLGNKAVKENTKFTKMRTKYKSFGNACFNYSRTFPPSPPQGETKEGRVRLFVSFNFLPGAIWNAFSLTLAAFNIKR